MKTRLINCFIFIGALLLLSPTLSFAADDAFSALLSAKSLKCTLGPGAVGIWGTKSVNIDKDKWNTPIHFDSIDVKAGKARIIGNVGADDISVIVTSAGITFVEQTGSGNLVFTTVFGSYLKGTNEFFVVSSRHMLIMDKPLPSQYHGTCKELK